jgi:hypothetical protein
MAVMSVTTMTVKPGGWDKMVEDAKKAKVILEKYGAQNVRLIAEVAGATPSGTAHTVYEAADLAALGKVLDSVYADPEILAMMTSASENMTWTTSILGEIPLS